MTLYIFDRDGTLTVTKSGRPCPNFSNDQEVLPGVAQKLKELKENGHFLAICSNQLGVEGGHMTEETAYIMSLETRGILSPDGWGDREGQFISSYKMAFYRANRTMVMRGLSLAPKPSPAMLLSIILELSGCRGCERENTRFIGNEFCDEEAARKAGIKFKWAHNFFNWPEGFVKVNNYGYHPAAWLEKHKLFKEKK